MEIDLESPVMVAPRIGLHQVFNCGLAKYLTFDDLKNMRVMNRELNDNTKRELRMRRNNFNFVMDSLQTLINFNLTFANYTPIEDLVTSKYCFTLPVLSLTQATPEFNTFAQRFGTMVTKLTLDFDISRLGGHTYLTSLEKNSIQNHVTLLLGMVKGQVEELHFLDYAGFDSCVLGTTPFPYLRLLNIDLMSIPDRQAIGHVIPTGTFLVDLLEKVPGIQVFEFENKPFFFPERETPTYLPEILEVLYRINPEVDCRLGIRYSRNSLETVAQIPVKITQLTIRADTTDAPHELLVILNWISFQAGSLTSLTFIDFGEWSHDQIDRTGLVFPSLPQLEELSYTQFGNTSLLNFNSAEYFPKLRAVSTRFVGNEFLVPLPTVTELRVRYIPFLRTATMTQAEYERRFQLTFPNVQVLTVSPSSRVFPAIFGLHSLTYLSIETSRQEFATCFSKNFIPGMMHLKFEQVLAMASPEVPPLVVTDKNGNIMPQFKDLRNLKNLEVDSGRGLESVDCQMVALCYLSKMKTLQRLEKLVIRSVDVEDTALISVYMEELKKYHDSVVLINEKDGVKISS